MNSFGKDSYLEAVGITAPRVTGRHNDYELLQNVLKTKNLTNKQRSARPVRVDALVIGTKIYERA